MEILWKYVEIYGNWYGNIWKYMGIGMEIYGNSIEIVWK